MICVNMSYKLFQIVQSNLVNWFNRFTIKRRGFSPINADNWMLRCSNFCVRETLLSSTNSDASTQSDNSSNSSENRPECYTLQWNYRRLCAGQQAVIPQFATITASVCLGRPFSRMFEHGCRALLLVRHKSVSEVWKRVCFAIQFISKLFSEFKSRVCAGQSSFSTIDSVNRPCFVHWKIE